MERGRYERLALELKARIEREGIALDNYVVKPRSVDVAPAYGVIGGWNTAVKKVSGDCVCIARDHGEETYIQIRMTKPGVVVGVGERPEGARVLIVYRD